MNPNSYESPEIALQVLTECCIKSVCKAYLNGGRRIELTEWKYTENIVYACCSSALICLDGEDAECKLAKLVVEVTLRLKGLNSVTQLVLELFRRFVQGHFLSVQAIDEEIKRLYSLIQNQQ
jgi:hypothetical protein